MMAVAERVLTCTGCGAAMAYRGRGRPHRWCVDCAAKKRAYYEANRDEIAAKKRAWRNGLTCSECGRPTTRVQQGICRECERTAMASAGDCVVCGDPLMFPSETGLCGFCLEQPAEQAAAA